jgi:hypothetical protein
MNIIFDIYCLLPLHQNLIFLFNYTESKFIQLVTVCYLAKQAMLCIPWLNCYLNFKQVDRWLIRDHSVGGYEILKQDPKLRI